MTFSILLSINRNLSHILTSVFSHATTPPLRRRLGWLRGRNLLATIIASLFVASHAFAQTWTPGAGYNAVTLSSNTYYTTPSYTPAGVSQFTVEAWINLPALGATDSGSGILELGSTIASGEALTLFTDWDDNSQTHTLNFDQSFQLLQGNLRMFQPRHIPWVF
jgi:hypothetical protein